MFPYDDPDYDYDFVGIDRLTGKVFSEVRRGFIEGNQDAIFFECEDGRRWVMTHIQDCCEGVFIEDISGDLSYLVNAPILCAEESTNKEDDDYDGSQTWTFYRITTFIGTVVIRWYGSSNGYYSESAEIYEGTKKINLA